MIHRVNIGIVIYSLVFIFLTGCGKAYTGDENKAVDPLGPLDEDIPVMMAISDPVYSMLTRGSGAFDGELENAKEMWENAIFYIYAFKLDGDADYRSLSLNDKEHCLVDGSVDENGSKMGKQARLNSDRASYLSWIGSPDVFYDRLNPVRAYRFFGFYLDDLTVSEPDIERTSDVVKLKNVRIDGTQDLMSTVATLTDEQKDRIRGMDDKEVVMNSLYSAYAARQGIHPVLTFHHQLSRVKFKIFPATPDAGDVSVESITIESKTDGVFTVAAKDPSLIGMDFSNSTRVEPLSLCEVGGKPLIQDKYKVSLLPEEEGLDIHDRTGMQVGESLLLAPGMEVYKMVLRLKQPGHHFDPLYYDLKISESFQAGMQYTVRVSMYGATKAEVTVQVDGWRDGGSIEIGPDEWPQ